jgi:GDSL-like Lipase/Acylhydrolase family
MRNRGVVRTRPKGHGHRRLRSCGVCYPRSMLSRLAAVVFGVILACLVAETAFRFIPTGHSSHSIAFALTAQSWVRQCWHLDAWGYRAHPKPPPGVTRTIVIVGDSFTAGAGLCNTEDRFGDQLAMRRPDYRVFVLGANGTDTREQLARLRRFPEKPDVIVLGYFGNDIDDTAKEAGYKPPPLQPYTDLSPLIKPLVTASYALNYVYWLRPHLDVQELLTFYEGAWVNPTVVRAHLADLDGFTGFGVPLVVVIFPYLPDLEWSKRYTQVVGDHFKAQRVPVIDVGEIARDLPLARRVVNPNDPHASAEVNHRIGSALARIIP